MDYYSDFISSLKFTANSDTEFINTAFFRERALKKQNGRCYYCNAPIWRTFPRLRTTSFEFFARQNGIPASEVSHFRCTAEHLVPKVYGGKTNRKNIVAACYTCNTRRGERPVPHTEYKRYVQERVAAGNWHPFHKAELYVNPDDDKES